MAAADSTRHEKERCEWRDISALAEVHLTALLNELQVCIYGNRMHVHARGHLMSVCVYAHVSASNLTTMLSELQVYNEPSHSHPKPNSSVE